MTLAPLLDRHKVLICVGSGGVGKTTVAATLALEAARRGRRAIVLTIDPARRLANALGMAQLDHQLRRVPDDKLGGAASGSLHAMMLDQRQAFDEVVSRHAADPAVLERLRQNRIYRQISSSLAGSHEYAAMAKLYDLCCAGEAPPHDLIVLDTPPTANALDFLDAPGKLLGAIDSPALQWFLRPYLEGKSFSFQVGFWGSSILKRLAQMVGSRFLGDMAAFIGEFHLVIAGLRQRAEEMVERLKRPDVAFVIVCSPEPLSLDEALFFHERLRSSSMRLGGFVVNRIHVPGPPAPPPGEVLAALGARPELHRMGEEDVARVAADLLRTYGDLQALAAVDARQLERLRRVAGPAPVVPVPLLAQDIHDLDGLLGIGRHLLGPPGEAPTP